MNNLGKRMAARKRRIYKMSRNVYYLYKLYSFKRLERKLNLHQVNKIRQDMGLPIIGPDTVIDLRIVSDPANAHEAPPDPDSISLDDVFDSPEWNEYDYERLTTLHSIYRTEWDRLATEDPDALQDRLARQILMAEENGMEVYVKELDDFREDKDAPVYAEGVPEEDYGGEDWAYGENDRRRFTDEERGWMKPEMADFEPTATAEYYRAINTRPPRPPNNPYGWNAFGKIFGNIVPPTSRQVGREFWKLQREKRLYKEDLRLYLRLRRKGAYMFYKMDNHEVFEDFFDNSDI